MFFDRIPEQYLVSKLTKVRQVNRRLLILANLRFLFELKPIISFLLRPQELLLCKYDLLTVAESVKRPHSFKLLLLDFLGLDDCIRKQMELVPSTELMANFLSSLLP